jgi:5-methylcytosine-specific restriction endonuclease McrA
MLKKKMTPKEFKKLLARDGHCLHCGLDDDTLVVQHRANRGHGGSKSAANPSNYIVLCSAFNTLIESDAKAAGIAKRYGYKISRYDNPSEKPVYDLVAGAWFILNSDWTKGQLLE